jgi:hypothetical protein
MALLNPNERSVCEKWGILNMRGLFNQEGE